MRIGTMLVFVLLMNVLMFLSQTAMDKVSSSNTTFFNYNGSWIKTGDTGGFNLDERIELPASQNVAEPSGNAFTDTWATLKNWFIESIPGARFLESMVNSPSNFLKTAGLPAEISFALGWLWHILGVFLFVAFIRGGSQI
jgi:hypothetical protein